MKINDTILNKACRFKHYDGWHWKRGYTKASLEALGFSYPFPSLADIENKIKSTDYDLETIHKFIEGKDVLTEATLLKKKKARLAEKVDDAFHKLELNFDSKGHWDYLFKVLSEYKNESELEKSYTFRMNHGWRDLWLSWEPEFLQYYLDSVDYSDEWVSKLKFLELIK